MKKTKKLELTWSCKYVQVDHSDPRSSKDVTIWHPSLVFQDIPELLRCDFL